MRTLLRFFVIVSALALLLSVLCPWVDPERLYFLGIFGVLHPWLLLLNALLLIGLLLLKSKSYWIPLTCLFLSLPGLGAYMQASTFAKAESLSTSIMSYNIGGLHYRDEASKSKLLDLIKAGDIDILALQECRQQLKDRITAARLFPYQHQQSIRGPVIFSKHEILAEGEIPFSSKVNACIWVDLDVHGQRTRLYNVHLRSAHISQDADALISGEVNSNKDAVDQGQRILRKFFGSSRVRSQEAKRIKIHADKLDIPSIIVGDLNETPKSYVYRLLSQNRIDSFKERGNGFGFSYRGKIPGLRIDYVFLPEGSNCLKHELFDWEYSDHAPLYTEWEWSAEDK